ncbi:MAG: thiamine diphosphokinase [Desulfamplus sp.]|nr:thiamine diphosphokinase [Desulfamplus sp.]
MEYLIISNGIVLDDDSLLKLAEQADVIVCVDGGARHLKRINVAPNILIGDMDSIDIEAQLYMDICASENYTKTIKYPKEKDASDTELAVLWAIEHGATYITLTGVTGSRMDHTLSNIFLLRSITKKGIGCKIVDAHNEIYLFSNELSKNGLRANTRCCNDDYGELSVNGKKGDLLSIIPITNEVSGLTLTGLKYPLSNATLQLGSSKGISNVFNQECASISLKHGTILIIKSSE